MKIRIRPNINVRSVSLFCLLWLVQGPYVYAQDPKQFITISHFSLFTSLDKSAVASDSVSNLALSSNHIRVSASAISKSTEISSPVISESVSPASSWTFANPVSQQVTKSELSFVRYERDELAYQPHFDDVLYFSCETWLPDTFRVSGGGLLANQARLILENYFVVPYSEWKISYDNSKSFWNYARLKFPENNILRLITTQNGLALVLYADGGAVFLAKKLEKYQLDLANIYGGRLRTSEL